MSLFSPSTGADLGAERQTTSRSLPLSIYRCAAMAGEHWNIHILLGAGAVFTLSGAANCIIYALTRRLVSFDGIGTALRRGSASVSGSRGSCICMTAYVFPLPS